MSNHENLMIDYGEENMSFFFVNYKKSLSVVFNMSKKVLKRVLGAVKCVGHTLHLLNVSISGMKLSINDRFHSK